MRLGLRFLNRGGGLRFPGPEGGVSLHKCRKEIKSRYKAGLTYIKASKDKYSQVEPGSV
jgi:hypothetical protein